MKFREQDSKHLRYKGVDGLLPQATYRVPRAAALLKKTVNHLLQKAMDPSLSSIRISKVDLESDMSEACFWFFCSEKQSPAYQQKLEGAQSFLRHGLAKQLLLRRLPRMRFKPDLNGIEANDYRDYIERLKCVDSSALGK